MNIITGETTENIETTSLRTQSDVKTKISKKVYIKIKRVIDVILASVALILLSPLFAIIAIAIKIDSKGPVFFAHKRIGKNGKIIKLYKFRSMVINAEELIKSFRKINKNIDQNIFKSVCNVNLNTIIGYHKDNYEYNFLDDYDEIGDKNE